LSLINCATATTTNSSSTPSARRTRARSAAEGANRSVLTKCQKRPTRGHQPSRTRQSRTKSLTASTRSYWAGIAFFTSRFGALRR
jgi:hypothetical protein